MAKEEKTEFQDVTVREVLEKLSSDPEKGLTEEEAKQRLEKYGENSIEEEKKSPLLMLLSNFWGPIPWMLEVAVVLAGVAGRLEDFFVILGMLFINGGVSYWHEQKASNEIEALKARLSPQARVYRDGRRRTIEAKYLTPGDIILVRMGDIVPGDAKLLEGGNLSVDESSLSGESLPVDKSGSDMIFSGTTVKQGEARAVVTATGSRTRFGKTVELVESAETVSHFQKAVMRIGYYLIGATGTLIVTIIIVGLVRGDPVYQLLLFSLVLTIAGIPTALPAVLSVTMSIGAKRLADMKAIVSRLAAMEEMAGLEVLFSDKTGTLTKNELELQDPMVMAAADKHDLILAAALTTRRDEAGPIDDAILRALKEQSELEKYKILEFRPFNPTDKIARAEVEGNGKKFSVAKGAPQVILDLAEADESERGEIAEKVDELGEKGFRALGVARTSDGGKWEYLGILPLLDPPREDSADVIADAKEHGIEILMVTGDHAAIAKQVAGQVGLGKKIVEASEIFGSGKEKENHVALRKAILSAEGFAEVTPEHKFKIIKQFENDNRIVGMTGDGVNDAPALKQADVGIAVAGATDAARSAAVLVLTEPGLGVIINAVEEARRIFGRMISYATFRIAETIRLLLFISLSVIFFNFYPVTAIMIVLLAILNDIPIMTIAFDNVLTSPRPVRWQMKRVLTIATTLGIAGVVSSFFFFWYLRQVMEMPREVIQTMIFLKLLVAGHMTIFLTRNQGWFWEKPWPSPVLFLSLECTQVIGTLFAVYGVLVRPVGWGLALAVWAYAFTWMFVLNVVKVAVYKVIG